MAIEKLNIDWQNKGETGYENSKINKTKLQEITDKIDEIIDTYGIGIVGDIKEFTKEVNVSSANTWYDTGIIGGNLSDGTYIMEVYTNSSEANSQYFERLCGTVAWHSGSTNSSDADEITLSKAGHSRSGHDIKFRILRTRSDQASPNSIRLQISDTVAWSGAGTLTIKFRKII